MNVRRRKSPWNVGEIEIAPVLSRNIVAHDGIVKSRARLNVDRDARRRRIELVEAECAEAFDLIGTVRTSGRERRRNLRRRRPVRGVRELPAVFKDDVEVGRKDARRLEGRGRRRCGRLLGRDERRRDDAANDGRRVVQFKRRARAICGRARRGAVDRARRYHARANGNSLRREGKFARLRRPGRPDRDVVAEEFDLGKFHADFRNKRALQKEPGIGGR